MEEKTLNSIKSLKVEIERIETVIQELGDTEEAESIVELYKSKLVKRKRDLINRKIEVENYLLGIDDDEIRVIMLLRYVDLRSWTYIAKKIHCDRTLPYIKVKKFLSRNKAK